MVCREEAWETREQRPEHYGSRLGEETAGEGGLSLGHTLGLQDIDKVQEDTGCPGEGGLKHMHYDAGTHLSGKNEVLHLLK